ncbi:MAG: trypsin-like peptidase domain-containing protein [Deltaproteobacteria bacterium]|nr:trypsin-like peptidase domain-containing protein [Deltaproteobacteria bacterium]
MTRICIVLILCLALTVSAEGESPGQSLWTTLDVDSVSHESDEGVALASFSKVVERARPAVVAIHTTGSSVDQGIDTFGFNPWRLFPEVPRKQRDQGIGSGFLIRADGYLVTNYHVVAQADSLNVRVTGLAVALKARVVGADPRSDLALLKIDPPRKLPVLPLGNSDELPVGAWVLAIGNPYGLTAVATKGIVSGKGRRLGDLPAFKTGYYDFIQTDAAIDLGNSGGPLLNLRGEVIGINTAINSRARGIGFAVPINLAKAVLPRLLSDGRVDRSYLGISVDQVTWELAESFGLDKPRGVLITKVLKDRPASKAGLRPGDVMLEFNGMPIRGTQDIGWRVATSVANKTIPLKVFRAGQTVDLQVTPIARRSGKPAEKKTEETAEAEEPHRLGLLVVALDDKTAGAAGLAQATRGVVVVGVEADAALHGIRVGDVITSINDKEIKTLQGFEKATKEIKQNQMIRFYILRQRSALYVAFPKRWE